ncbi:hypothetical protein MALU111345_19950 [Marinicrinis lubricantis]
MDTIIELSDVGKSFKRDKPVLDNIIYRLKAINVLRL